MADLSFPASSTPGATPQESQGRLINCWAEKNGKRLFHRRSPGLSALADSGLGTPRGLFDLDGVLYAAFAGSVVKVVAGVVTPIGSLPGSDGVTFARNNRTTTDTSNNTTSTPDLVVVRSTGGAYLISPTAATIAPYPDANLPATANSVSFLGGYFLFTLPDARIFASGLNTTAVNALSFATAESSDDGLVRGLVSNGRFYAMGTTSIEPWLNVGNTPFPLARATSVISLGALVTMAMAGTEDGWSLTPIFVAQDCTVQRLNGYDTTKISTPDVERFVQRSTAATLEASVYTFNGNSVWALSSDQGTWEFNATTGQWNERLSVGATRWRGSRSVFSNGAWVTGDTLSGRLLKVDSSLRTEAGAALTFTAESAPVKGFPNRFAIPDLFVDVTLGVGSVAVPNPQARISWSKDGGTSFSGPVSRAMGANGASVGPMRVSRLGLASHHGLRVRVSVSDDVDFALMGASLSKPETAGAVMADLNLIDTTNYLTSYPPALPADVARTNPNGSGLPTPALMDWEQYQSNWYKNTVVSLDTRVDDVKSATDANTAEIQTETVARTTADEALAQQTTTLTTQVNDQSAQLQVLSASYDGIAVAYSVTGYIDGVSGGFIFTGVKQNNGTVDYEMVFNSNVTINGNLIVTGTINTPAVAYSAVNTPYIAGLGGNQSYGVNNNWVDVLTVGYSGSDGAYARVDAIIGVARYTTTGGNISYGRCRVVSDTFGDLTGPLYLNYGVVDVNGNSNDAANGYITNPLAAMVFGINGGDTIRLQFRNIPGGGSGITYWLNNQTKLLVEVRKR